MRQASEQQPSQPKYWVYLVPLGVFGFLMVVFFFGLGLDPRRVPSPLIGQPVPQFSLPSLGAAAQVFQQTELQGEISLFNVWATWCVSCRQEHPVLMQIAASRQVPLYGLFYKDDPAKGIAWLQRHGDPYRANAVDLDGRVGIEWGAYGTPETFLVDAEGIIRYKHIGPISWLDWQNVLSPMIASLQGDDS